MRTGRSRCAVALAAHATAHTTSGTTTRSRPTVRVGNTMGKAPAVFGSLPAGPARHDHRQEADRHRDGRRRSSP